LSRKLNHKGRFPLWLEFYLGLVGLLIGLTVSTLTGLIEAEYTAGLILSAALPTFFRSYFPDEWGAFVTAMSIALALVILSCSELLTSWIPDLETRLGFVLFSTLTPVVLICVGAAYSVYHRWHQRSPG
jgi:hypothetical protein